MTGPVSKAEATRYLVGLIQPQVEAGATDNEIHSFVMQDSLVRHAFAWREVHEAINSVRKFIESRPKPKPAFETELRALLIKHGWTPPRDE